MDHSNVIRAALLRRQAVTARTGVGKTLIYGLMKTGKFPLAVRIGARAVAWRESEIEEWINGRETTRTEAA